MNAHLAQSGQIFPQIRFFLAIFEVEIQRGAGELRGGQSAKNTGARGQCDRYFSFHDQHIVTWTKGFLCLMAEYEGLRAKRTHSQPEQAFENVPLSAWIKASLNSWKVYYSEMFRSLSQWNDQRWVDWQICDQVEVKLAVVGGDFELRWSSSHGGCGEAFFSVSWRPEKHNIYSTCLALCFLYHCPLSLHCLFCLLVSDDSRTQMVFGKRCFGLFLCFLRCFNGIKNDDK